MRTEALPWTVVALTLMSWACSAWTVVGADSGRVPEGSWGGVHARLVVTAEGASVEFDCAHGSMGPLEVDDEAGVAAVGTYTRERPGPVTPPGPSAEPAMYRGSLDGDELIFQVELDGGTIFGPFEVFLGRSARIFKCRGS